MQMYDLTNESLPTAIITFLNKTAGNKAPRPYFKLQIEDMEKLEASACTFLTLLTIYHELGFRRETSKVRTLKQAIASKLGVAGKK